ncbi:MAG: hypothetical protein LUG57_03240 [Oscillospiraceae bacterium]|nr:hypothetical protein [Oscillospiraceae bacterium]
MTLDSVSYIYSQPELAAPLALVGCREVPFFSGGGGDVQAGLASLEESLLVSRQEDCAAVDRVAAFLALRIGACEQCLCLDGGPESPAFLGLFYGADASILLTLRQGRWVITPYQDYDQASAGFIQSLPARSGGMTACLKNKAGLWRRPGPFDSGSAGRQSFSQAACWVRDNIPPQGKEQYLWKP